MSEAFRSGTNQGFDACRRLDLDGLRFLNLDGFGLRNLCGGSAFRGEKPFSIVSGVPEVHAVPPLTVEDAFADAIRDVAFGVEEVSEDAVVGGEPAFLGTVLAGAGSGPALAFVEVIAGTATKMFVGDCGDDFQDFLTTRAGVFLGLRHGSFLSF